MKHTGKTLLLLVSLVSCSVLETFSQISPQGLTPEMLLPQLSNLTPEAASLGKYGAFQVSEYSGAANISIPLYTVKSGDISFPINLYYDGTGIKVEQDATFVGLGWNLSYGGMISHIICGEDDFREPTGYRDYYENWWKGKYTTVPKDQPCQSLEFINETMVGIVTGDWGNGWGPLHEDSYSLYDRLSKGYDTPDVFQASFCGHNLSFIIDRRIGKNSSGNFPIVIINDNPRKYNITYEMGSYGDLEYPFSFTIKDDKGISYVFNKYNENTSWGHIDSYYLTKIYGTDGQNGKSVVDIEYEQNGIGYGGARFRSRPAAKFHQSNSKQIDGGIHDRLPIIDDFETNDRLKTQYNRLVGKINDTYYQYIGCYEPGYCHKVYPKRIITTLDTIEFNKGSREDIEQAFCISGITIRSKAEGSQRNIKFSYNYFEEEFSSDYYTCKRLKLTGLAIDDQKYQFEYDNKKLPSFASYSKDYWGYYNGANPKDSKFIACTPAYSIKDGIVIPVEHLDGSNRLASETRCNVGMLKRIVYPTGGYTDYEFEANRFNDKYYYPDASDCNISLPPSIINITDCAMYVSASSRSNTKTFTASQKDYKLRIEAILMDNSDEVEITIKNSSNSVIRTYYRQGFVQKYWDDRESLSLDAGETYTVETKLTTAKSSSTMTNCTISHDIPNTNVTALPKTKNEKGGYSIGGGLRVKTIKNYDANNTYLNGVEYEYEGGKLLAPTVQMETHYIDFELK